MQPLEHRSKHRSILVVLLFSLSLSTLLIPARACDKDPDGFPCYRPILCTKRSECRCKESVDKARCGLCPNDQGSSFIDDDVCWCLSSTALRDGIECHPEKPGGPLRAVADDAMAAVEAETPESSEEDSESAAEEEEENDGGGSSLGVVAGAAAGGAIVLAIASCGLWVFFVRKRRKSSQNDTSAEDEPADSESGESEAGVGRRWSMRGMARRTTEKGDEKEGQKGSSTAISTGSNALNRIESGGTSTPWEGGSTHEPSKDEHLDVRPGIYGESANVVAFSDEPGPPNTGTGDRSDSDFGTAPPREKWGHSRGALKFQTAFASQPEYPFGTATYSQGKHTVYTPSSQPIQESYIPLPQLSSQPPSAQYLPTASDDASASYFPSEQGQDIAPAVTAEDYANVSPPPHLLDAAQNDYDTAGQYQPSDQGTDPAQFPYEPSMGSR